MAFQTETSEVQSEVQVVTDAFSERTKIVEKFLEPHDEADQAGFKRRVYKQGETTFSFRGREELSTIEAMKGSQTVLLGSDPVHVDTDNYQEYKSQYVASENAPDNLDRRYFATKDLQGVLALAIKLGAKDPNLENMLQEIRSGVYSGRSLDLIDRLVAVNCIKDDKKEWDDSFAGGDAEAIVVLSLLGNNEASDYLDSKLGQMGELDKLRGSKEEVAENNNIDKQVCVHATKFKPNKYGESGYEIKTTGDATNFEYVRNTVHVSVNHKVVSHMMGSWGQAPYVLISPMRNVVEANGLPMSDQEWDTWWVRNPGETLKFPNAVIVEPGKMPLKRTLCVIGDRLATFKGEEYTVDDLLDTEKSTGHNIEALDSFRSVFFIDRIENKEMKASIDSNWDTEKLAQLFVEKYFPNESYPGERKDKSYSDIVKYCVSQRSDTEMFEQSFKTAGGVSIADRVGEIFKEVNVSVAYKGDVDGLERAVAELSSYVSKSIEGEIFSELSSSVVKSTIKKMGFEPTGGGNWPSAHVGSPSDWLTKGHFVAVDDAKEVVGVDNDGNEVKGKFDWTKFKSIWSQLPNVDPKSRRVIYASGAFNSRVQ